MPAGGIRDDRWGRYNRWNAALAAVVYAPELSGLPVFLDLEEDVLQRVAIEAGEHEGVPRDGLIAAVRPTLNEPSHPAGVFGGYRVPLLRWHVESGEPPPTIALLAVLSLAAEDMHRGDGFTAQDYYNRLMPLLGVIGVRDKQLVEGAYRRCSAELWTSLNEWLEFEEGERGVPTAFSLGFAHVGLPVSQAILRATDRDKLREFFEDFGFAPRSHLGSRDMEVLLGEWVCRAPSPATTAMQTLWRRSGARARIVEGACALLESWDGPRVPSVSSGHERAHRPASIQIVALHRTFPKPALELNFTGPTSHPGEDTLDLIDADGVASQALAIEPFTESRWRLAEPGRVDPLSILDGRLRLRDDAGLVMERRPRRVIVLTHDDLLQVFFEVERLPLGEAAMILCKDHLAGSIEVALSIIARRGFSRATSGLPGLPPGWTLFVDVQVLAALPEVQPDGARWEFADDLNVLQALASSQLVVEAGLRLPGHLRRWSSLAPPEVRVATEDAASITVRVSQTRALAGAVEPIDTTTEGSAAVIDLADLGLPDGDYEIVALNTATTKTIDQVRLRLRSADVSSRSSAHIPSLGRVPTEPMSVLSASICEDDGALTIRGAVITDPPLLSAALPRADSSVPAWWDARKAADSRVARSDRVVLPSVALEDCFRTGRHIIVLPTYYGSTSASSVQGHCRQCGIVKRYPAHYRARSATSSGPPHYVRPAFDASRIAPVAAHAIPPDVGLDALSHDQVGNARALEQVALQIEPSQLFVDRFLRGLESLGHLEVRRDGHTLAPTGWEVAPTALVQTKPDAFVLVGFRSHRIVAALEAAATAIGAMVERRQQENAPDRVRVRDCDPNAAESLARCLSDETHNATSVVTDGAASMARLLPPLSSVCDALSRTAMVGYRSVNRWDEELARWVVAADASAPGAYQLLASVSIYCLRDAEDVWNGTMRRGDARLVKHLASSSAGFPLLGYDQDTETLYAPLGAELPGLYSRAAVLASGLLPNDDLEQRLVAYVSVPADVAGQLIALMRS